MTRKMLAEEKALRKEVKAMVQVYGKNRLWKGLELTKVGGLILALVRACYEDAAKVAENEWKNASNNPPEWRQNQISHGCLAAAAAIRGKGKR